MRARGWIGLLAVLFVLAFASAPRPLRQFSDVLAVPPVAAARVRAAGASREQAAARTRIDDAGSEPPALHEQLAARARNGEVDAALELARLLDACVERAETRAVMRVITSDMDRAPSCDDADKCAAVERVYDEFQRSLAQWREVEQDCSAVPRDWLETRGRWLRLAAQLGDGESRACYALAAAELAPPPMHREYAGWLEHWRVHALPWSWQAWRDGEPRAALALARIYGPNAYFRGDASEVAEADALLQYRFERLLTEALLLDPDTSDVAASALSAAATLSDAEQALTDSWIAAQLPRIAAQRARRARTPDACWQHFAMFEPRPAAVAQHGD